MTWIWRWRRRARRRHPWWQGALRRRWRGGRRGRNRRRAWWRGEGWRRSTRWRIDWPDATRRGGRGGGGGRGVEDTCLRHLDLQRGGETTALAYSALMVEPRRALPLASISFVMGLAAAAPRVATTAVAAWTVSVAAAAPAVDAEVLYGVANAAVAEAPGALMVLPAIVAIGDGVALVERDGVPG